MVVIVTFFLTPFRDVCIQGRADLVTNRLMQQSRPIWMTIHAMIQLLFDNI